MMNKPGENKRKKSYNSGMLIDGNSNGLENHTNNSYSSEGYSGFKGASRDNLTSNNAGNFHKEKRLENQFQKKEDSGVLFQDSKEGGNQNNSNSNSMNRLKKKGLGKNKFYQIYFEMQQNRKNGVSLNQDWLKELNTQFPQIFIREHLAPVFIDKTFCDCYYAGDAFDNVDKKLPSVPVYHNYSSDHHVRRTVNSNSHTATAAVQPLLKEKSESSDDPDWEVNENEFDFEFKSFDKEKYVQDMISSQKNAKNNLTKGGVFCRNVQQGSSSFNPAPALVEKKDNILNFCDSSGGFSASQFFSLVNTKVEDVSPPLLTVEEYEQEYEDIDMKLERLAKETKTQVVEDEHQTFEDEEEKVSEDQKNQDSSAKEQFSQRTSSSHHSDQHCSSDGFRQIHLDTFVQNEFQDEQDDDDDDDDDENNDQTFKSNVQKLNTQPVGGVNLNNRETNGSSYDFGYNPLNYSHLTSQMNQNQLYSEAYTQFSYSSNKVEDEETKNNLYLNIDEKEEHSEEYDTMETHKRQGQHNEGRLEQLIMNEEDAEDIKERMYEQLFMPMSEQERREQEEKKKEKERKNLEKIAELMSYQEEEKNNFFQSIAYLLQANPREEIWIYKDDQGIQQGPFDSIQMDSWKDHFINTEVSYHRVLYWIKYKDITLYSKLYSKRIRDLLLQEYNSLSTLQNDQATKMYHQHLHMSHKQPQQDQSNNPSLQQSTDINPQIKQQILNLQMQILNTKNPEEHKFLNQQFMNMIKTKPQKHQQTVTKSQLNQPFNNNNNNSQQQFQNYKNQAQFKQTKTTTGSKQQEFPKNTQQIAQQQQPQQYVPLHQSQMFSESNNRVDYGNYSLQQGGQQHSQQEQQKQQWMVQQQNYQIDYIQQMNQAKQQQQMNKNVNQNMNTRHIQGNYNNYSGMVENVGQNNSSSNNNNFNVRKNANGKANQNSYGNQNNIRLDSQINYNQDSLNNEYANRNVNNINVNQVNSSHNQRLLQKTHNNNNNNIQKNNHNRNAKPDINDQDFPSLS